MLKTDVLTIGSATVDHFLTIEQSFSSIKAGGKNPHSKLWGIQGDFYSRKWVAAGCGVLPG